MYFYKLTIIVFVEINKYNKLSMLSIVKSKYFNIYKFCFVKVDKFKIVTKIFII